MIRNLLTTVFLVLASSLAFAIPLKSSISPLSPIDCTQASFNERKANWTFGPQVIYEDYEVVTLELTAYFGLCFDSGGKVTSSPEPRVGLWPDGIADRLVDANITVEKNEHLGYKVFITINKENLRIANKNEDSFILTFTPIAFESTFYWRLTFKESEQTGEYFVALTAL